MSTRIGTYLSTAADLLRGGDIVAIPTETVYGLAADAFNPEAVLKIFTTKARPSFDPLIVHIGRMEQLGCVVLELPEGAERMMNVFWPGPLTLVLPKRPEVPDIVTSGLDTVGVRMPAHPMALELLSNLDFPLAAPSANPFGYVSPTTAQHVADQLGERIPYILDGGACNVGVESTIIGWEAGEWRLYRPGGVPVEAIERVLGVSLSTAGGDPSGVEVPVQAPGMLESHYAPRKPVQVGDLDELLKAHNGQRIGMISFSKTYPVHRSEVLSPSSDLKEAAQKLFAALRMLDASDCDVILAERFPEEGLGRAINDRLRRAAAKR
ncbi:MAG: threonylcarbamoyl-AMP synthase [Flavobacteriales bacterium]|nr:threonylcarbamoyl-AMP synthase [Flavobacteriales bacterium]